MPPRPDSAARSSEGPVLEATRLSRNFGDQVAVRELDLTVSRGEYFCIVGPSGSGKTTLLRMLAGFERPDAGEIRLAGTRVDQVPPERRDLNTVFQGYALFPHLSVGDNVSFGLRMKGVPRGERKRRVEEVLELVGLAGFQGRAPATLSGGEQQRVALARAVVNRPSVLLLDEPLAALDRRLRHRMQDELRRIQGEVGITFLHVNHDQQEALRLADRLAVMRKGRFLQVGPPPQVYHRPATPFVATFLGSANLLPGVRVDGAPPRVRLDAGPILTVEGGDGLPEVGCAVLLAVRPEAIQVDGGGGNVGTRVNRVEGRLERRQVLGGIAEIFVRLGPLLVEVHLPASRSRSLPAPGDPVTLVLDPADLVPLKGPSTETGAG
jgi:spermidine/putrescine transport system ATP-binding protein